MDCFLVVVDILLADGSQNNGDNASDHPRPEQSDPGPDKAYKYILARDPGPNKAYMYLARDPGPNKAYMYQMAIQILQFPGRRPPGGGVSTKAGHQRKHCGSPSYHISPGSSNSGFGLVLQAAADDCGGGDATGNYCATHLHSQPRAPTVVASGNRDGAQTEKQQCID
ncbi:hypothetical protein Btru_018573 [Bulinus truncatus]|nr:hypothetical protein Btru_018573 [Bulinus truncatus]